MADLEEMRMSDKICAIATIHFWADVSNGLSWHAAKRVCCIWVHCAVRIFGRGRGLYEWCRGPVCCWLQTAPDLLMCWCACCIYPAVMLKSICSLAFYVLPNANSLQCVLSLLQRLKWGTILFAMCLAYTSVIGLWMGLGKAEKCVHLWQCFGDESVDWFSSGVRFHFWLKTCCVLYEVEHIYMCSLACSLSSVWF